MKRLLMLGLAVVLVLALALTSCAPAPTTPAPTTPAPTTPPETLKVGVLAPLTGPVAAYGLTLLRTLTLTVEGINENGGITVDGKRYVIELVPEDTKYSPVEGRSAAEKLISRDKVEFTFGPMASTVYKAVGPLLNENKVLHLDVTTARWCVGPDYPYSFRPVWSTTDCIYPVWSYIAKNFPDIKTVAIITGDDETGHSHSALTAKALEYLGLELIETVFCARGTKEFYSLFAPVLTKEPDLIDLTGLSLMDAGHLIKQLREAGYTGRLNISHVVVPETFIIPVTGPEAAEGLTGISLSKERYLTDPRFIKFKEDYIARWGEKGYSEDGVIGYLDTALILAKAIEQADSLDPTEVRKTLVGMKYDSPILGPCVFSGAEWYGVDQQLIMPLQISEVTGGEFVVLAEYKADDLEKMNDEFFKATGA